jgi:hypothetical protein
VPAKKKFRNHPCNIQQLKKKSCKRLDICSKAVCGKGSTHVSLKIRNTERERERAPLTRRIWSDSKEKKTAELDNKKKYLEIIKIKIFICTIS